MAAASASTLPAGDPQQTSRSRLAVAAGVAFVLGATGTAAAFLGPLHGHGAAVPRTAPTAPKAPPKAPTTAASRTAPIVNNAVAENEPVLPGIDEEPVVKAATPRRHRRASGLSDARAAELAFIQKAQAAYADGNLPRALELLAEHGPPVPEWAARRGARGPRVRSLAGCGRAADARRALQAFADDTRRAFCCLTYERRSAPVPTRSFSSVTRDPKSVATRRRSERSRLGGAGAARQAGDLDRLPVPVDRA